MFALIISALLLEVLTNQRAGGGFNAFDSSFPKIFKISDFLAENQQIRYHYTNTTIDISKFDEYNQIFLKKIEQKYQ